MQKYMNKRKEYLSYPAEQRRNVLRIQEIFAKMGKTVQKGAEMLCNMPLE